MTQVTEQVILDSLRRIEDPDLHKDIVTLGFVRDLKIDGGNVSFRIVLTTPACPVKAEMESAAKEIVGSLPGVTSVSVTMDAEVPKGRGLGEKVSIQGIKNIVAVSSGKGGVGKSTVAVNLAVSLALDGARVGLMDADVYGPNVPIMLGASEARPEVDVNKLIPIEAFGVKFMSMALLQPGDKPMIVRGPILHGLVKQFLTDVKWGELDYLIVDMPPGTGDVQLSLAQLVPVPTIRMERWEQALDAAGDLGAVQGGRAADLPGTPVAVRGDDDGRMPDARIPAATRALRPAPRARRVRRGVCRDPDRRGQPRDRGQGPHRPPQPRAPWCRERASPPS